MFPLVFCANDLHRLFFALFRTGGFCYVSTLLMELIQGSGMLQYSTPTKTLLTDPIRSLDTILELFHHLVYL